MLGMFWKLHIQILYDFPLVLVHQARFDIMIQRRKSLLDTWRDIAEHHGDAETNVSHDCATHNTPLSEFMEIACYYFLICMLQLYGANKLGDLCGIITHSFVLTVHCC